MNYMKPLNRKTIRKGCDLLCFAFKKKTRICKLLYTYGSVKHI